MSDREAVVACALTWLETPWRHQARRKGLGVDCIGLIGCVGAEMGYESAKRWLRDPSMHNYSMHPDSEQMTAGLRRYLVPIELAAAQLADVLVMRWEQEPAHFALVTQLQPLRIVHAYRSVRKVSDCSIDGYWREGITWRSLIVGAWRYQELVD